MKKDELRLLRSQLALTGGLLFLCLVMAIVMAMFSVMFGGCLATNDAQRGCRCPMLTRSAHQITRQLPAIQSSLTREPFSRTSELPSDGRITTKHDDLDHIG